MLRAGLLLEFVDQYGGGVGQLVAGETEQLLAHGFAGQEFFAAVGEFVLRVFPGLLRQIFLADGEQPQHVPGVLGRHRDEFGKRMSLLHLLQPGGNGGAALHLVEFVGHQQCRHTGLEQRQNLGIGRRELAGLHHEQHQIDIADSAQHGLVQRFVQRPRVHGLEAGGIHKDELRRAHRANAGDAVPRGLRLARGDADLLAHQSVEQGGLADVWPADDGDRAAALCRRFAGLLAARPDVALNRCRRTVCRDGFRGFHLIPLAFSTSSIAAAAACSPARRVAPMPRSVAPSSETSHSTSKVCL